MIKNTSNADRAVLNRVLSSVGQCSKRVLLLELQSFGVEGHRLALDLDVHDTHASQLTGAFLLGRGDLADLAYDAIGLPIGLLLEEAEASRLVDRPLELSLFRLRLLRDPQKVGPLLLLLRLGGAGVGSARPGPCRIR